jgi:putative flavoprotein involved in K+ transport
VDTNGKNRLTETACQPALWAVSRHNGRVFEVVVIGGGQAGLSTSYHLSRLRIEHVVVERGRVANTWRTARWDGFHLNTPNWATQLPGMAPSHSNPDAFAPLADVISSLEGYAERIHAPLRTGVNVTALRQSASGFELDVDGDSVLARAVVVATGAFQRPTPLAAGASAPRRIQQMHTSEYRRPSDLPDGDVLIVGSGQSGCEIAQTLLDAQRMVHMAVGRCPWASRRYRGRDLIRWMVDVGLMDETIDSLPSPAARVAGNVAISGARGGVDCNPPLLEKSGARLYGRLTGFRGRRATFAGDLGPTLAKGFDFQQAVRARCDEYARTNGLDLPREPADEAPAPRPESPSELDLERQGITAIIWANGFRPGFDWIDLPIFDDLGFPRTRRGVTEIPGVAFIGLPWLATRRSSLLLGVGGDAEYVASKVAAHLAA